MSKSLALFFQVETTHHHRTPRQNLYRKGGPTLSISNEIYGPLASLADALDDWQRAAEEAESKEPKRFTFNGTTYEHVPGTETFQIPGTPTDEEGNPIETLTALQIMKQQFKPTKTYYRRITPIDSALPMFYLGDSARFKILRAAQLHYSPPPVSDETRTFTPFFNFLSEGVEDHWMVQQQYSSCKWAAPKDEELATSLLLHYGWAQKYPEYKLKTCCIYQLRRAEDGIHLIISEPHTFNDRLFAACTRAHAISDAFKARSQNAPYDILFREACRVFFSYNRYYVSMTSDYRQAIMNKIQAFCLRLTNALSSDEPTYPSIEQPEHIFEVEYDDYGEPREYILKWEDFIFEEKSAVQQAHLENVHLNQHLKTFLERWEKEGLDINAAYSYAVLKTHFTTTALSTARDRDTIILDHKEGRTKFWKLNPDKLNYERS